ncbi:hypothetical protein [Streptomyces sp. DH8]|uniref:hypothetical protein n=1 Tax=Streptomyces sp. DH8 TaxID=2857008 RepID=UPI001E3942F5|nr:hypothetical protein [Streptomyces sp. DH8]
MENDHTPVGPRCGNNPNFKLSPGDKAAVDKFMAYLRERAATKQLGHVTVTEARAAYGTSEGEGAGELFPDEGPDELRAELAKLIRWHKEDGDQLAKMRGTIERLRAERAELIRQRDQIAMDTTKAPPAPADRAAILRVVDRLAAHAAGFQDVLDESDRGPWGKTIVADIAELRRLADDAAAGVQPPAPRIRCAHTDVLYGQCVRYLDDHNGDCQHEHQPAV